MTEERILPRYGLVLGHDMEEAVFQALGAASVCWEPMDCTGVFQDGRAKQIGAELIGIITQYAQAYSHELSRQGPRVERLLAGNRQFGCDGTHRGNGTEDCPAEPHHHHDEFCRLPLISELNAADIDYRTFKAQKR